MERLSHIYFSHLFNQLIRIKSYKSDVVLSTVFSKGKKKKEIFYETRNVINRFNTKRLKTLRRTRTHRESQ